MQRQSNRRGDEVHARELLEQRAEEHARREGDTTFFREDEEDDEEVLQ